MKFKMGDVVQMYDALLQLAQSEAPFRINYWIMMNINQIKPHFEIFCKERDAIYAECLQKHSDGSYFNQTSDGKLNMKVKPDKINIWNNRFEILNNFDIDISPVFLDIDSLLSENPNWNFKANFLLTLSPLIKQQNMQLSRTRRTKNGKTNKAFKN